MPTFSDFQLAGVAQFMLRVRLAQDYLRKGRLSPVSVALQWLVLLLWMVYASAGLPADWPRVLCLLQCDSPAGPSLSWENYSRRQRFSGSESGVRTEWRPRLWCNPAPAASAAIRK